MRPSRLLSGLLVVLMETLSAFAQPSSDTLPVVNDPVLIGQNGMYYLFATGRGITVFSSSDKIHWQKRAPVFARMPLWTFAAIPGFKGDAWAPEITYHDGKYYLYYAVSSFGKNTSAIGVATNETLDPADPAFKWIDRGMVVQSIPGRDDWNAIDPNFISDDHQNAWLAFGSFWNGLKLVQLDASLTKIAEPQRWYTIAARPRSFGLPDSLPGDAAIEAPFIFPKNGYFYLFASYGYCCRAEKSTYHVRVGRADKIEGPYFDKNGRAMVLDGGTEVIGGDERFYAAGHNGVTVLEDGDYFVCHGYDRRDNGMPKLIIKKISWMDGWPVLK